MKSLVKVISLILLLAVFLFTLGSYQSAYAVNGIVDNTDPGFSVIGVWGTYSASNPDIYGIDLRYHAAGVGEIGRASCRERV